MNLRKKNDTEGENNENSFVAVKIDRRERISLWEGATKKWASYLYRTATTVYPCYLPVLGEFNRSWSYKTCPRRKVRKFFNEYK